MLASYLPNCWDAVGRLIHVVAPVRGSISFLLFGAGGTFRRSRLRPQAALEDLQYLKDTSPEESNVLFQLAKVYRLTGDNVKFTQLLAEVRDVAPKSLAKIRRLAESIKPQDVGEEVMDEG